MALLHSPRIVTDGLVLCLDAANRESYPGSGNVWRDLAGSNNGTLTNGPTFNSANGGSIVFDGSNDFVVAGRVPFTGTSTASVAWGVWVSPASNENAGNVIAMSSDNPQASWNIGLMTLSNQRFKGNLWQGHEITGTTIYNYNSWYYVVVVWGYSATSSERGLFLYVNGNLEASKTNISYSASNVDNFLFLGQANPGAYNTGSFAGRIGHFHVYGDKILTPAEIQQNYNTLKGRYNL